MRCYLSAVAVGLAVFCLSYEAPGQTVRVADTIGDITMFPEGGQAQDRFETIIGLNVGSSPRITHTRFDLSAFSAELANPSLQLSAAEVTLTERADRNSNNGTLEASISAYLHTQAVGDWVVPDNGGSVTLQPGVFGASWSNRRTDQWNPDEFARDCAVGSTCGDPNGPEGNGRMRWASVGGLRSTVNSNSGPAFGGPDAPDVKYGNGSDTNQGGNALVGDVPAGDTLHTFDLGNDQETVTINLLDNITSAQMTDTLNEWVTGFNAGIGLFSDIGTQIFFESGDAVNDGDGAGWALDTYTGGEFNTTVTTESGNGEGGALLRLTFDLAGNVDGDSDVDLDDLTIIRHNFGMTGATMMQGDLTGEGDVNGADFRIWKDSYDYLQNQTLSASASVPEPTALMLCSLGLGGLALSRRRNR